MEDKDEFGDLYTDVLSTFPPSSAAGVPLAIDLNLKTKTSEEAADGPVIQSNSNTIQDSISGARVLQNDEQSRVVWAEEEDDSDSDSDDDLQIVLNDSHHAHGPSMGMMLGSDDDDEPPAPAPDCGDDQLKDSKPIAPPPPISYNPFHAHFKYVRPGAPPLPAPLNIPTLPARRPPPPSHKPFLPGRAFDFTLPSHK